MSKKNTDGKPMSKGKKALNIALIVFELAIVIVAIAFSISILLSTGYESSSDFGESSLRLMPVLTDSMAGDKDDSFKAGDLIIVKSAEKVDLSTLEVGDIITYLDYVGGDLQFVTHRIIDIEENEMSNGTVIREYTTRGDAEDPETAIPKTLYAGDIKGVYVGKLAGVGSAVFWLQDPTHFFLVIMLPLILLLLYNAYLVVRIIIEAKLKKQREQLVGATANGAAQPLDEETIKRLAVEEYIKKKAVEDYIREQQQKEANAEGTTPEAATPEAAAVTQPAPEAPAEAETVEKAETEVDQQAQTVDIQAENVDQQAQTVEIQAEKFDQQAQTVEKEAEKVEEPTETVEKEAEKVEETAETVEKVTEIVEKEKKPAAKKPAAKSTATKTATKTTAKTAAKSAAKTASKSEGGTAKKTAAKSAATKTAGAKTAKTATKTAAKKTEKKS